MTRRIAFYAPLKSPDHPVPSGDRTVARLYMRALAEAGFDVLLASDFRSYDGAGSKDVQRQLRGQANAEISRILKSLADPPALWFTYHCHYKAPDLLGPAIAETLGIGYVIAEPSHAPKRAEGAWADFHAAAEHAIRVADIALVATQRDMPCVASLRDTGTTSHLPPFLDAAPLLPMRQRRAGVPLRLITVAMMRAGDKLASYRLLAETVSLLPQGAWQLTIMGDGPARAEVEKLFAPYAEYVTFVGAAASVAEVAGHLAQADLFVWPAVNEAYGMALLEAQAIGVPVIVGHEGGVADVVRDGVTGVLVPPRDPAAMASRIKRLIDAPEAIDTMGKAAANFVRGERSLGAASARLRALLADVIERRKCVS